MRIVSAKFVNPYVKSNKNDIIDAEAIAEAVTRPTMRFVEIRSPEQVDLQALAGKFKADLPRVVADEENDLSPAMRRLLTELFDDVKNLEARIKEVTEEIEAVAAADNTARRLMTVPGIGPLAATALLAAAGRGLQFRKARDMTAGLASCRGSTLPAARRPCSASASEEARI